MLPPGRRKQRDELLIQHPPQLSFQKRIIVQQVQQLPPPFGGEIFCRPGIPGQDISAGLG